MSIASYPIVGCRLLIGIYLAVYCGYTSAGTSYISAQFTPLDYQVNGIDDEAMPLTVNGRFGAFIDQYTSVEWRLGAGVEDDTLTATQGAARVNIDLLYGVYLRGGIPLGTVLYPYVSIGYTWADLDFEYAGATFSDKVDDVSFAVGFDLNLGDKWSINGEYQQYINEKESKLAGPSLGLTFRY